MNVFIDLGCHDGTSVEEFRNWRRLAFPDKEHWQIYAFDPNPNFATQWENIADDTTEFIQKAAWIDNSTKEFALDEGNALGSTLMPGKIKIWDNSLKIKVKCFDFSSWLKQFDKDYVVVKMDIEGAEFPVLNKMLYDGTITIPDKLLIEFHPNKVQEYTTTDKNDLIEEITGKFVDILEWH